MTPIEQMLTTQATLQKTGPQLTKLSKACTGLEASFLQTMVSQMRQGTSAVHFGEQFGGDMFNGMFDDTLADILAKKNALGVSQAMYTPLAGRVMQQAEQSLKGHSATITEETTH